MVNMIEWPDVSEFTATKVATSHHWFEALGDKRLDTVSTEARVNEEREDGRVAIVRLNDDAMCGENGPDVDVEAVCVLRN